MRKVDLNKIKKIFLDGVSDVEKTYANARAMAPGVPKNLIIEFAFMAAATKLESYISDAFVGSINADISSFQSFLIRGLSIDSSDKSISVHAKNATGHMKISWGGYLTAEEIQNILDPKGFNVIFQSRSEFKELTGKYLSAGYKAKFHSITDPQWAIIESIRRIRNYLAHKSLLSDTAMQAALIDGNLAAELKRAVNRIKSVSSYLDSKPTASSATRFDLYITEVKAIANTLI